ncbi:hypothetical protein [Halomarina rubra]|uniref:Cox cluster protein n=1 Tax=Halomarina rubra TaxID=2071873 RepID=A0ABD6ATD0_9EURY|nr:hypothetical protein [Halomarina rubra]
MFESDDPAELMNDLLLFVFIPAALTFSGLWLAFRLVFDEMLSAYGLPPIEPQPGYGAIAAGHGRMALLIVLTSFVVLVFLGLYARRSRAAFIARGQA